MAPSSLLPVRRFNFQLPQPNSLPPTATTANTHQQQEERQQQLQPPVPSHKAVSLPPEQSSIQARASDVSIVNFDGLLGTAGGSERNWLNDEEMPSFMVGSNFLATPAPKRKNVHTEMREPLAGDAIQEAVKVAAMSVKESPVQMLAPEGLKASKARVSFATTVLSRSINQTLASTLIDKPEEEESPLQSPEAVQSSPPSVPITKPSHILPKSHPAHPRPWIAVLSHSSKDNIPVVTAENGTNFYSSSRPVGEGKGKEKDLTSQPRTSLAPALSAVVSNVATQVSTNLKRSIDSLNSFAPSIETSATSAESTRPITSLKNCASLLAPPLFSPILPAPHGSPNLDRIFARRLSVEGDNSMLSEEVGDIGSDWSGSLKDGHQLGRVMMSTPHAGFDRADGKRPGIVKFALPGKVPEARGGEEEEEGSPEMSSQERSISRQQIRAPIVFEIDEPTVPSVPTQQKPRRMSQIPRSDPRNLSSARVRRHSTSFHHEPPRARRLSRLPLDPLPEALSTNPFHTTPLLARRASFAPLQSVSELSLVHLPPPVPVKSSSHPPLTARRANIVAEQTQVLGSNVIRRASLRPTMAPALGIPSAIQLVASRGPATIAGSPQKSTIILTCPAQPSGSTSSVVPKKAKAKGMSLTLPSEFVSRGAEREMERKKRIEERKAQDEDGKGNPSSMKSRKRNGDLITGKGAKRAKLASSLPLNHPRPPVTVPKSIFAQSSSSAAHDQGSAPSATRQPRSRPPRRAASTTGSARRAQSKPTFVQSSDTVQITFEHSNNADVSLRLTKEALEKTLELVGPKLDLKRRVSNYLEGVLEGVDEDEQEEEAEAEKSVEETKEPTKSGSESVAEAPRETRTASESSHSPVNVPSPPPNPLLQPESSSRPHVQPIVQPQHLVAQSLAPDIGCLLGDDRFAPPAAPAPAKTQAQARRRPLTNRNTQNQPVSNPPAARSATLKTSTSKSISAISIQPATSKLVPFKFSSSASRARNTTLAIQEAVSDRQGSKKKVKLNNGTIGVSVGMVGMDRIGWEQRQKKREEEVRKSKEEQRKREEEEERSKLKQLRESLKVKQAVPGRKERVRT